MTYLYLGLLAATVGLFIATHIYQSKRGKRSLMCPRNNDCTKVVTSRYSATFGIPIETLGVGYYVLVAGFFAAVLAFPILDTEVLQRAVVISVFVGVLFSFYLLYVQAFRLRAWCIWCITSAFMTILLLNAASGWIGNTRVESLYANRYQMDTRAAFLYRNQ